MAVNKLNPYLSFNGTAEKAIRFYERALGARDVPVHDRFLRRPASEASLAASTSRLR